MVCATASSSVSVAVFFLLLLVIKKTFIRYKGELKTHTTI